MQKNILILEDSPKWLANMKKIAESVSYETEVFAVVNLKEAYQIAMKYSIDLFVIDIILDVNASGDTSGMEFANNIRQNKKYQFTPIIFVTSLEDPRLRAYSNIHCYSYIEKPYNEEETAKIIEQALAIPLKKENCKEYIYFRKEGILYGFRIDEIIYIESSTQKTRVHSVYETIEISRRSIKNLLTELDSDAFIQCNRGVIINRDYIEYIDPANRFVKLRNVEKQVEIGAVMKSRFLKEIENG
ncbi:MAG: response regulator transcription factor [Lachnospiraceae bacterium]|nr:response regulator transcription factor [Lachnospiraceae bacterium]